MKNYSPFLLVAAGLWGCSAPGAIDGGFGGNPADIQEIAGKCFATETTPAIIETTTADILVTPAAIDPIGNVEKPAEFRTETTQKITQARREVRFETPCTATMDRVFVASLQRALKARGHYLADITGEFDTATAAAVRSFQRRYGFNSATLSTESAKRLGLLEIGPVPAAHAG